MGRTTVLSPHPDDAVLSLWHVLAGDGDVQVVNLFTGAPSGHPVSYWDRLTGVDSEPGDRVAERLEEDRLALGVAGRTSLNLALLDAQYRNGTRPLGDLIDELADLLPDDELVLAPAAIALHEDHVLTRAAALDLRSHGYRVALYADLPHAALFGWPAAITGDHESPYVRADAYWEHMTEGSGVRLADLKPEVAALGAEERARKMEAVRCYSTQVPALEQVFCILSRPQVLAYEVIWPLP